MSSIRLTIVTPEGIIYSGSVKEIIATGAEGKLGILPGHAPLITILQPGELRVKEDNREVSIAVCGGFLEVRPDRVIILADAARKFPIDTIH